MDSQVANNSGINQAGLAAHTYHISARERGPDAAHGAANKNQKRTVDQQTGSYKAAKQDRDGGRKTWLK